MWIWTLDEELLNLGQVETIEAVSNYPEGANFADVADDEVEPEDFEIVAFLASGAEVTLFRHHDEALVMQALELLAQFIGAHDMMDGMTQGRVLSLAELMNKAGKDKN